MISSAFTLSLLFLAALFALNSFEYTLKKLKRRESSRVIKLLGNLFFYKKICLFLFKNEAKQEEFLQFSLFFGKIAARFFSLFFLAIWYANSSWIETAFPTQLILLLFVATLYYGITEYLPQILSRTLPKAVWLLALPSSLFLFITIPFTLVFFKFSELLKSATLKKNHMDSQGDLKQEIFEIVQEAELSTKLSPHDKQMIESVVRFQTKIAREVMVPRIDMFALGSKTTIREAAKALQSEGFSRVPVYKETIDQIVGILMYRDILSRYMAFQSDSSSKNSLDAPIESLLKPTLYTPETKKISNLLQEFKKKQSHLAIVVDEYGGTAGMITIEDILEEIVGEIEDEYDEEEDLYTKIADGVYLVDGRLSVLDAKDDLGIVLPQEGEYDTIGGFIFQRAGAIPEKGFKIQLDECELEVVKSNDRRIEKVKISKYPHDV